MLKLYPVETDSENDSDVVKCCVTHFVFIDLSISKRSFIVLVVQLAVYLVI